MPCFGSGFKSKSDLTLLNNGAGEIALFTLAYIQLTIAIHEVFSPLWYTLNKGCLQWDWMHGEQESNPNSAPRTALCKVLINCLAADFWSVLPTHPFNVLSLHSC